MSPTVLVCLALSAAPPPVRLDAEGFPLPPHAVARLGSLRFHHEGIRAVALSPDASRSATIGDDAGEIRVWDNKTGAPLGRVAFDGPDADFDFAADGTLFVVPGREPVIHIHDPKTGERRFVPLRDEEGVDAVAVRADGGAVAVGTPGGDGPGYVRLFDPLTGRAFARMSFPPTKEEFVRVRAVAFAPDGSRVAAVRGDDGTVVVWDARTGRQLGRDVIDGGMFLGPDCRVFFDSRGDALFVCHGEVVDRLDGRTAARKATTKFERLTFAAIAHDGAALVSVDGAGNVRRLADRSGRGTHLHAGDREFGASGAVRGGVAAVSYNGRLLLIDHRTARYLHGGPDDHSPVSAVEATAEGRAIVSRRTGPPAVYDLKTNAPTKRLAPPTGSYPWSPVRPFPRADRTVAVNLDGDEAGVFDGVTGKAVWSSKISLGTRSEGNPAVSPDGSLVAWSFGFVDAVVEVRDAATGKLRGSWPEGVRGVTFSPDGKRLAAYDPHTQRWLIREVVGGVARHRLPGDGTGFAFRPDGRAAAVTRADGVALVPLTPGDAETTLLPHQKQTAVAFEPDGRRAATAGPDRRVRLWVREGRVMATLRCPEADPTALAFTPDGKYLLCGTAAGTCLVFRVPVAE